MLPAKTDVLIVGAGPTGLALAVSLRQAGVDHVLVDALPSGQNTSRAAVVHAHTLEALAELGVTDKLIERGLQLSRFTIRDRDRPLLEIGFDDLPSDYRCLLMVPQVTTEQVLADRLDALGGAIHRCVQAVQVRDGGDVVQAVLHGTDGAHAIEARYVVGADGMRSMVRDSAGIAFEGEAYDESFILADVRMDWPLGRDEVSLFFSPAGLVVVAPLPDGAFRIVATLDDAPEIPAVEHVQQLLDARGPSGGVSRVREVVWGSRFRVHHRLAETYRRGRLLVMGDAAHVHSPAGGQGMNCGLVDAVVLGRALTRVIRDGGDETLLDDYADLRRSAAARVLPLAGRLTAVATTRARAGRMLRNLILRLVDHLPRVKKALALNLSGVARKAFAQLPAASAA